MSNQSPPAVPGCLFAHDGTPYIGWIIGELRILALPVKGSTEPKSFFIAHIREQITGVDEMHLMSRLRDCAALKNAIKRTERKVQNLRHAQ